MAGCRLGAGVPLPVLLDDDGLAAADFELVVFLFEVDAALVCGPAAELITFKAFGVGVAVHCQRPSADTQA